MLAAEGGIFEVGARVELGDLKPAPEPPHVEDHWFWPENARSVGRLGADEYLELLHDVCEDSLAAIFGPDLERDGWTFVIPKGRGYASLGCLRVGAGAELGIGGGGKVRVKVPLIDKPAYLPVTDVRYWEADHTTPRREAIEETQRRLAKGAPLLAMVGLTRPWSRDGNNDRHWLQFNGLCLEDSPLGPEP